MDTTAVNADRRRDACVQSSDLPWQASPQPGVERRLLERIGGEVALATSLVRYAPASRFEAHVHGAGEEFLVLQGVFSDEHAHYPAGTYVRNPPGSAHRPFSTEGCVIFVKLRQMASEPSGRVVVVPGRTAWQPMAGQQGCEYARLHADARETVSLVRLPAGAVLAQRRCAGGEELLVVEGSLQVGRGVTLGPWGWRRSAAKEQPALATRTGALLWIKRGHLGRQ